MTFQGVAASVLIRLHKRVVARRLACSRRQALRAVALAPFASMAFLDLSVMAGPDTAPVNLAPNSQWEIWSAVGYGPKERIDGTSTVAPIPYSGNSTGSNEITFFSRGPLADLKVGDLILPQASRPGPYLPQVPLRVTKLSEKDGVTASLPLGLTAASSRPGMLQAVNIGMTRSVGTGDAADGWKKPVNLIVWREDNSVNVASGAYYALGMHKDSGGEEAVYASYDVRIFRGRRVVFGAELLEKVSGGSGRWRPFVRSDGRAGALQAGNGPQQSDGYGWAEAAYLVPKDATYLFAGILLDGPAGATYYMCNPVFTVGTFIGPGNYTKPRELFAPVVHISPITWVNAAIRFPSRPDRVGLYSNVFDAYAETGGAIAPTVRYMTGSLEGIDANPVVTGEAGSRVIAWRDNAVDPVRLGPIMGQYGVDIKSFGPANIPLDGNGYARYWSAVAADSWYNVSMDLDLFYLQ
jgi:hypothetical protein